MHCKHCQAVRLTWLQSRCFYLVQRMGEGSHPGLSKCRLLQEGPDALFRATPTMQDKWTADLIPVRTVWLAPEGNRKGGFELKTLRSRILSVHRGG